MATTTTTSTTTEPSTSVVATATSTSTSTSTDTVVALAEPEPVKPIDVTADWEYDSLPEEDQQKIKDCMNLLTEWKQEWKDEQKARDWRLEGTEKKKFDDVMVNVVLEGIKFKINKYITKLDFDQNSITDKGILAIAEVLRNKDVATFKRLYLCENKFTDEGAKALAEALKENDKLKLLHVKKNNLTNVTAEAFQDLLKVSTTLEVLDLSENKIDHTGAGGFVPVLKDHNKTLIILEMSFMKLSPDVKMQLKRLVGKDQFNRDLKESDAPGGWKKSEKHPSLGWVRIREEDDLKHYRH